MTGALEPVRILDLSWGIAGPIGVLLLAEQGADVIKVEPPGGDPFRAQPGYHVWNRSRRSIELDLKSDDGKETLLRLADEADVLVEAFSPGTMQRLGLDYASLGDRCPQLVYCSIPAYPTGHRSERRWGYDALVQARSGQQHEQPGWRPGPIHLHFPAPSMGACFLAASGILAALIARERTGRGQHVETSLYQGVLAYTTMLWQEHEKAGAATRLVMAKSYPPGVHQGSIYQCADGEWVHAATMSGRTPTSTVEGVLGIEAADPMELFRDPAARAAHDAKLRAAFLRRRRDEVVEELHAAGLGAEAVVAMEHAYRHPQLLANAMVTTVDDPLLGETTQIGVPIKLSATPGAVRGPQPKAGEHTAEVLGAIGAAPPPAPQRGIATPPGGGPLAGIKVLDIGQYLAGPFGPMILADLGAEVIKVEPVRGDGMRLAAMPFIGCQRGKRGIAIDLKSPEGVEVVLRLAEQADVVHHNMTRGTAARLGIDYESLRARNPALIHCNTYAYGAEGPMSDFGGLDPLYQAACGLEFEAGAVATGNAPLYLRFGMTDTANAFLSVVGVLTAVLHRERTGVGQDLWTSLLNGAALFSSDVFLRHEGEPPRRPSLDRSLQGTSACYRLYETQQGWIQVAAVSTEQWQKLCAVVGCSDLAEDPRAASMAARQAHRREVEAPLEAAFATRTAVTWLRLLDEAGVPAEIAIDTYDGEFALHDADNERLGLVTEWLHPLLGRVRQFGALMRFSAHPEPRFGPPPLVGEHSRSILLEAGFEQAEIERLIATGQVYQAGDEYPWPV